MVPFTKGDVIKVAARTETDIIVDRTFVYKQPEPYGDCLVDTSKKSSFNSQYFDYIVKTMGQNYSQQYCFALCIQSQFIKNCGCAAFEYPVFKNSSNLFCELDNYFTCSKTIKNLTECKAACPFECFSIDYSVKTHSLLYPTTTSVLKSNNITDVNFFNIDAFKTMERILYINVYYHSTQYTLSEENILIQPADVVANFGGTKLFFDLKYYILNTYIYVLGTLGLFLGFSLLSFIELIDLVCKIVHVFITFCLNRRKNKFTIAQ